MTHIPDRPLVGINRLKEVLHYEPNTGRWTRLVKTNHKCLPGQEAGWVHYKGYRVIALDGRQYFAHILAFFYMTERWPVWPDEEVDHRDHDTGNNCWTNLRLATREQNSHNGPAPITNTSGTRGVSYDKRLGKWRAYIGYGPRTNLGWFDELSDAISARYQSEMQWGEFRFNHEKMNLAR